MAVKRSSTVFNIHPYTTHIQVSQLTHSQSQKEELLRLYVKDARERDQAEAEVSGLVHMQHVVFLKA